MTCPSCGQETTQFLSETTRTSGGVLQMGPRMVCLPCAFRSQDQTYAAAVPKPYPKPAKENG